MTQGISTMPCAIKFTGKERDTETGLDYFGARYYGSNMGRFTSADSEAYASALNPQTWNLYAYTLNNPLRYVDPTGHVVECANNANQCKKDAAASTGNAEAAKRVTTETKQHGFWIFKWTTTTIKITGDINSFRALSTNASKLADLVGAKQTITVTYDQYARPSFWANGMNLQGGSTSMVPSQRYDPQVWIDPDHGHGVNGVWDPDAVAQGVPQANFGEEMAHELEGHVWSELFGKHPAGTKANMRDSIDAENGARAVEATRKQKNREKHHNMNEARD